MKIPIVIDLMIFEQLSQFRQSVYEQLGKAKDAVFELMDAALTSISTVSFVGLCQSPVFRRQWSSVYAALHDSRLPQARLMQELARRVDTAEQPILAGDRTFWPRHDAATLQDRIFDHDSRQKSAVGQSYSTLAWIPEESGSWALPLRHERISSFETPGQRAAFQLQHVTRHLERRPLAVYDRGYGNAKFVHQTAVIEADLLLRLAANRCVFGVPPAYGGRGAPRKHGVKFKFKDPTSWPEATETIAVDDPHYGRVQLMRWSHFHFKQSPNRDMDIIRVEVIEPVGRKRKFQVLWLAWLGQTWPGLQGLWRIYLRRFALEHWYRLAKQRLHWTQPQLSSNPALERWSLLVVLMTWQLWLARNECIDTPFPWQSPQDKLAPGRIVQGFASILVAIGTPAKAPKPRGKSPGRATGHCPSPRSHYPTVKKRARNRKQAKKVPKSTTVPAA
ncbi:NF041680 family putative transposase [Leptolyngbya sp. AN02str]|uniref:NF041680 family putative transposase n=1 Tax=Leptolyngbya sp. AN02str TaxID=3423363 RepID=UPI003D323B3F